MNWRWRKWRTWAATTTVVAGLLSGCGGSSQTPQDTLKPFLAAWNKGNWPAMAALVEDPSPDFSTSAQALVSGLGASASTHTVGVVTTKGASADAAITSSYRIPAIGSWTVQSSLGLVKRSGRWVIQWSPKAVDPALGTGDVLGIAYTWAPRALILGAGGTALTVQEPEEDVGVEGSRIKNPNQVTSLLESVGATAAEVSGALSAAKAHPTYFEPVVTITLAEFNRLGGRASALYQVPGTVFQPTSARSALTPGLAAHLVGSVGPITAQELGQLGPPYDSASQVGQDGLEAAYQSRLAGSPGATISVVDGAGHTVEVLTKFPAKPGSPLITSIDPKTQEAAESALAGIGGNVALVAVDASTGQVTAAVSQPADDQFDQALEGVFPPGSTFKVLTASALIEKGLSPSSPATCPATADVDGEIFHNAEGDSPVSTMAQAFAESCNTAFVQLAAANLDRSSFPAVASQYDIATAPNLGLLAAAGSVPEPKDQADLAATSIGQAGVLVSPLDMAMVAAAIDSGQARLARLVAGAADDTAAAKPLPPAVLAGVRQMMAEVVSSGTAAGTGLPAGTYAKTGTSQYGSGNPLPTDAWLMGYRGNVAFAMVVQDSKGNGGPVDGPIVARFLDALAG